MSFISVLLLFLLFLACFGLVLCNILFKKCSIFYDVIVIMLLLLNALGTVSFFFLKGIKGHGTAIWWCKHVQKNVKYGARAFVCVVCMHT